MGFAITEKWESGEGEVGQNPNDELLYIVTGTPDADPDLDGDNPIAVTNWALGQVDPAYNGNPMVGLRRTRIAPYKFLITARYGNPNYKQTGEKSFSFNTAGAQQHMSAALKHIQTYTLSGSGSTVTTSTPMDGFLNVGEDNSIGGLDADLGIFGFQITSYIPPASMTESYVSLLFKLTDTVNATNFTVNADGVNLSFNEGECRFTGATGSKRSTGDWELTQNFSALPNASSLSIQDFKGIDKRGWEYICVRPKTTATSEFIAPTIDFVFVDQLYGEENWTGLVL